MTYESYRMIFYIGIGIATLMLLISVILFFVFKIPSVIGDLSGSTARKAIENIREKNKATGYRSYSSHEKKKSIVSKVDMQKNISMTKELTRKNYYETVNNGDSYPQETIVLQNNNFESTETTVLENGVEYCNETTVFENSNANDIETTLLVNNDVYDNETSLLEHNNAYNNETTILENNAAYDNETTVLAMPEYMHQNETTVLNYSKDSRYQRLNTMFEIEEDITFVHTNETIY